MSWPYRLAGARSSGEWNQASREERTARALLLKERAHEHAAALSCDLEAGALDLLVQRPRRRQVMRLHALAQQLVLE